ncbi:MAG: site-2 protease family protein [Candidatus Marinimicrobia bacterium]|jgi:Zn-dependent protease|nr:site-2 protease family protein [Candidatus Neomarinimicrobiota bacterium]MCK9559910.1 site-2 protease family protein [Candidatus Neomarinimicrobiota bacterium]MDD5231232.1 site-2 protease family protein [Candidatus Neomarinimicrobiota bacterium]
MNIQIIILLVPPILLALTFHEFMHGWAAYKLGDPTAKYAGRLTMNPLVHLDPIGTLMLFLVRFGWARPVPVDPRYFRNPKRDMLIVSVAGPLANMGLALLSGLLVRLFRSGQFNWLPLNLLQPLYTMTILSLQINLALAIFNLLPIPPLDGSKILFGLIPHRYEVQFQWLERYGGFFLMAIIVIGMVTNVSILGALIGPFVNIFSRIFGGI